MQEDVEQALAAIGAGASPGTAIEMRLHAHLVPP